jgi:hypothetical protein
MSLRIVLISYYLLVSHRKQLAGQFVRYLSLKGAQAHLMIAIDAVEAEPNCPAVLAG